MKQKTLSRVEPAAVVAGDVSGSGFSTGLCMSSQGRTIFLLVLLCIPLGCEPGLAKVDNRSGKEVLPGQIQSVHGPAGEDAPIPPKPTVPSDEAGVTETRPGAAEKATDAMDSASVQAEEALRKATVEKDKAKAAGEEAKRAGGDAQRGAETGNASAARDSASEAVEAAKQATEAAKAAGTYAQEVVDAARGMVNRGKASEMSRHAEVAQRAAAHYARSAEEAAAGAILAADAARRAASARTLAEVAKEAAQKAVQEQLAAESHAEDVRKASAEGSSKDAEVAVAAAQASARNAAECAKESSGHVRQIEESILKDGSPSGKVAGQDDVIRGALAEGRKAAQEAEAASRGAAKAAEIAQKHITGAGNATSDAARTRPSVATEGRGAEPSLGGRGSPPEPSAGRPRGGEVDMAAVPTVPELVVPRQRPAGVIEVEPVATTRPTRILGAWSQVDGDRDADFALGGYESSSVVFRVDGIMEVRRVFGVESPISMVWRMSCDWSQDGRTLTLGKEENARPRAASLKGFMIPGSGIRTTDAAQALPLTTTVTRFENGDIRFNGKTYRSAK